MDSVDREIMELQQRWAEDAQAEARAHEEAFRERRIAVRERVRRGEVPPHIKTCVQCLRAALELNANGACPEGKQCNPGMWN